MKLMLSRMKMLFSLATPILSGSVVSISAIHARYVDCAFTSARLSQPSISYGQFPVAYVPSAAAADACQASVLVEQALIVLVFLLALFLRSCMHVIFVFS